MNKLKELIVKYNKSLRLIGELIILVLFVYGVYSYVSYKTNQDITKANKSTVALISEIKQENVYVTMIHETGQVVFLNKKDYHVEQILSKEVSMMIFALKSSAIKQDYTTISRAKQ